MQREHVLAGGAGLLVALLVTSAVFVPGVFAEPQEDVRPSHLAIDGEDSTIRVAEAGGETVRLSLDTRLAHEGGTSENVSLEVQVRDAETGLLADSARTSVGDVSGRRTVSVRSNVTVAREGGYDVRTIVYEDGVAVARTTRPLRGVGALEPGYARSPVRFQYVGSSLPSVTYRIESVRDGRVALNVSTYLVNRGDEAGGDVQVRLRARQTDSNVVADEATVDVGTIDPGHTVGPHARLVVPEEYNYWIDAVLTKDGVVVGTVTERANLDPTRTVEPEVTRTEVGFSAGEFTERRTDRDDGGYGEPTTSGSSGPGFGAVAALAGLVAAALLVKRRHNA